MTTPTQPPTTLRQVSEGERTAQELRDTAQKLLLMAAQLEAAYGVKYDPNRSVPIAFKPTRKRDQKKSDH